MQAHHLRPFRVLVVVGGQHAAFAGSNGLGGVEAESRQFGNRSNPPAAVPRRQRVSRILDHMQAMAARHRMQRVKIASFARNMDRNDGPCLRRNPALRIGGINIEASPHAVAEYGTSPEICDDLGGRGKGVGGQQHLIPRLQADGVERQLQRGGTGIHRQGVLAPDISGKLFFELNGDWSGGKPARG